MSLLGVDYLVEVEGVVEVVVVEAFEKTKRSESLQRDEEAAGSCRMSFLALSEQVSYPGWVMFYYHVRWTLKR